MRIYHGNAVDGDAPIISMVVIAENEASARRVMHEYEADAAMDDPRLDDEIWLIPELTHVQFLGEAAPHLTAGSVFCAVPGALRSQRTFAPPSAASRGRAVPTAVSLRDDHAAQDVAPAV